MISQYFTRQHPSKKKVLLASAIAFRATGGKHGRLVRELKRTEETLLGYEFRRLILSDLEKKASGRAGVFELSSTVSTSTAANQGKSP